MKSIGLNIQGSVENHQINHDALAGFAKKEKAVFSVADGVGNKGCLSGKWAQFLCDRSPLILNF